MKEIGTFAHPYFALILVTLLVNVTNFPVIISYIKVSRNVLEQFILIFRYELILLAA